MSETVTPVTQHHIPQDLNFVGESHRRKQLESVTTQKKSNCAATKTGVFYADAKKISKYKVYNELKSFNWRTHS